MNSELSAEARMVIAEARGYDEATVEDRNRVRASWLAAVAAGAGISTLSNAASANTASAARFGFKAKLGGLVAAGAVGALALWPTDPDAPASASGGPTTSGVVASENAPRSQHPAQDVVPAEVAEPQVVEPQVVEPQVVEPQVAVPEVVEPQVVSSEAVEPARRGASPRTGARASAESTIGSAASGAAPDAELSGGQLGEEIALISTARRALAEGDSGQALAVLAEHGQRFTEPLLKSEARALTVDALCASGDREAARRVAEAFLDAWPGSPLSERVRNACR